MKTSAVKSLRGKLASGQPVYGLWVTLESPGITEIAVALRLDWVVIDAEHGNLDWTEVANHLRATVRSDTVALVRIAELNGGLIKRALDLGADGVVVPWIETAEQLKQAIAYAKYPVEGVRGIGAERATGWGECLVEHTGEANDHVLVVPILESVNAEKNLDRLAQVDGVEIYFFGPADFSSSAGYRGQWEGSGVAERILAMKDALLRAGKNCGVVATSLENLDKRKNQGFRMIGLGMDAGLLLRSLHAALAAVGRDQKMQASLVPVLPTINPPLERPPELMRPDRPEVESKLGASPRTQIAPGVDYESLVGSHVNARKLNTGFLTMEPGTVVAYHNHPFAESLTLVGGSASVEVEGRIYALANLDNIVIPRGLAHCIRNTSSTLAARFHVSLAHETPFATPTTRNFETRIMPDDANGVTGAERVNRYATAPRGAAGPNTEFIDCFNADLMPGLEMSGGYGLFHPTGRLPAHVHDFDESICIISGEATCIVEGRRYTMTDGSTALQPRGRVHYFINETNGPMEMLWVYAGPRPERIVVAEHCATVEGDPWK